MSPLFNVSARLVTDRVTSKTWEIFAQNYEIAHGVIRDAILLDITQGVLLI